MFDPTDAQEREFMEFCVSHAEELLNIVTSELDESDLDDEEAYRRLLGTLVVATGIVSKIAEMDLHTLLGAVMTAYRMVTVKEVGDGEESDV